MARLNSVINCRRPSSGVAVAGQLALLAEQMKDPRTANDGFAMSHLASFMENNLRLHACLPPDASSVVATGLAGAAFPLPPTLSWVASQPDRSRDFATYNRVDSGYEKRLDDWFNKLNPLPVPAPAPVSALADTVESVASFVFRDSLLMPMVGKLILNDPDSYRYLAESIRMHPDQETLKSMMVEAGFDRVTYHNMTSGIVALHRGIKP